MLGVAAALFVRARPVDVVPPGATGATGTACDRLQRALPRTVAGQPRLDVRPLSVQTAAWGGAPIVLRCGVGRPRALVPTSVLYPIGGIDWLPEPVDGGTRFTSVGLLANVEVSVPHDYQPAVDALFDLGPAIARTDPATPANN